MITVNYAHTHIGAKIVLFSFKAVAPIIVLIGCMHYKLVEKPE